MVQSSGFGVVGFAGGVRGLGFLGAELPKIKPETPKNPKL